MTHRRSIRLRDYDCSQAAAYFVTICAQGRACVFGELRDGEMTMNAAGRMLVSAWDALPDRFADIDLDGFVVMPHHLHGIIVISSDHVTGNTGPAATGPVGAAGLVPAHLVPAHPVPGRASTRVAPTARGTDGTPSRAATRVAPTVGDVIGACKSLTTLAYVHGVGECGWPGFRGRSWQRNYYGHIIRDDRSLRRIRQYIIANPAHWRYDEENPDAEIR